MKSKELNLRIPEEIAQVYQAMAKAKGMPLATVLVGELARRAIEGGKLDPQQEQRVRAEVGLREQVRQIARELVSGGRFPKDVILRVFKAVRGDTSLMAAYRKAIGVQGERRAHVNRRLAEQIRDTVGGVPVRTAGGNPAKVKLSGELIRTYGPLVPRS